MTLKNIYFSINNMEGYFIKTLIPSMFINLLHFVVTAFGFAGIDLFIYPIFFEADNRIRTKSQSFFKLFLSVGLGIIKKIGHGVWQLLVYLLIAWPRVFVGIYSSVRIHLSGIDQPVNWQNMSNAGISAEETSERGLSFSKFLRFYASCMLIGAALLIILVFLIINGTIFTSALMPLNMGIIIASLLLGPFISYAISKKIRIK